MPAMKRPAVAGAPTTKRVKHDLVDEQLKEVRSVLSKRGRGADALAADVVSMLLSMLPSAIGPALTVEESQPLRHPFQEKLLDWVAKELHVVEAWLQAEVEAQAEFVTRADAERLRQESAESEAAAELETKVLLVCEAMDKFRAAKAMAATAKTGLIASQAAEEAADVALLEADTRLTNLKDALQAKARLETPIANAEGAAEASPKSVSALATSLRGLLDDSLLDAMKVSLAKQPGTRGEFDGRVLEQAQVALDAAVTAQTDAIKALSEGKDARASAVERCKAEVVSASDAATSAEMAESNAQCAKSEAELVLKSAQSSVARFDGDLMAANGRVAAGEGKVEEFRTGPLAAFEALRHPAAPKPPNVETAVVPEKALAWRKAEEANASCELDVQADGAEGANKAM